MGWKVVNIHPLDLANQWRSTQVWLPALGSHSTGPANSFGRGEHRVIPFVVELLAGEKF